MTITEIIKGLAETVGIGGLVILLGNLIKIEPLKISLWASIARKLGNALNYDVTVKLKEIEDRQSLIETKLDVHIKENERYIATQNRKAILMFAREILYGQLHTQEDYAEALSNIDAYDTYCASHPEFPNNRALCAKQMIIDNYKERLDKADFLAEEYRAKVYNIKGVQLNNNNN